MANNGTSIWGWGKNQLTAVAYTETTQAAEDAQAFDEMIALWGPK